MEIDHILGSSAKTLLKSFRPSKETYFLIAFLVAYGFSCGYVLVETWVWQESVRALVVLLVEVVSESILEPVSVKCLWVVDVFVHFK